MSLWDGCSADLHTHVKSGRATATSVCFLSEIWYCLMSLMSPVCCCSPPPPLHTRTHTQTQADRRGECEPCVPIHEKHTYSALHHTAGPWNRAPFQQTALTHGFAVKLPQAMAVAWGPKACKQQTTMSRLTRVHASIIQTLFTTLFPQAAELRWKTMRLLCITHILSSRGMVKLQVGGCKKESSAWTPWNAALLDRDKPFRSFWLFQSQKKRATILQNLSLKYDALVCCREEKNHLKSLASHLFGPFSNYIWRCLNVIKICAGWTAWAQITAPKWLEKHASLAFILITNFF